MGIGQNCFPPRVIAKNNQLWHSGSWIHGRVADLTRVRLDMYRRSVTQVLIHLRYPKKRYNMGISRWLLSRCRFYCTEKGYFSSHLSDGSFSADDRAAMGGQIASGYVCTTHHILRLSARQWYREMLVGQNPGTLMYPKMYPSAHTKIAGTWRLPEFSTAHQLYTLLVVWIGLISVQTTLA